MKIADLDIEIERKSIKNIHLAVYPPDGRIHLSVPHYMKDEDISMFLYSKLSWIRERRTEVFSQPRQTDREFVSGENHYLFGQRYLLKVTYTREKANVIKGTRCIEMFVRQGSTIERRQEVMDVFYREELKPVLDKMIHKWSEIMVEDVSNATWQIQKMQKKWGTCNTEKRKILFNLLLARVPVSCVEYVVVHEMIHLKVHQHDKEFAMLLNKYLPDWQVRKKELDEFISLPIREA